MKEKPSRDKGLPWRWVAAGLLVGLAVGLIVFFGNPRSDNQSAQRSAGTSPEARPLEGQQAPAFSTESAQGDRVALSDYRGQVVMLNFWATWCGPCEIEMPHLQERYERYRPKGFVVLAVNFDEPSQLVAAYGEERGLSFPLLLDPGGEIQRLYRVRGYPSTYLLNRDGTIADVHIGLMTENRMDEMLASVGLEGS